ncbi:MAG: RNA polymerase sigma factor [Proteobacteria bacterium]|nr:RNA polymerase sigma factor [Pseudomonadota bacterium]
MIARALNTKRTDAELMDLLARGEMDPLGELYMRYGSQVRSLLWRLLPDDSTQDAEDLCQEVFMTAYQTASRFQHDRELRPWLFGIAAHKARSSSRKKWIRRGLLRRYEQEDTAAAAFTTGSPESGAMSRREINLAMAGLPHNQREVLVLYVTQNMSGEQIADALNIRLNTVWTRLRRARLAMRAALQNQVDDKNTGEER